MAGHAGRRRGPAEAVPFHRRVAVLSFSLVVGCLLSVWWIGGALAFRGPRSPAQQTRAVGRPAASSSARSISRVLRQSGHDDRISSEGHNEFRLKMGHAIDILKEDVRKLWAKDSAGGGVGLMDFTIFDKDVEFVDQRAPGVRIKGLEMYKRFLDGLRFAVMKTCTVAQPEISSMNVQPTGDLRVRWKLTLIPHFPHMPRFSLLAATQDILAPGSTRRPVATWWPETTHFGSFVVEGVSVYEFHPWTAQIVRHSIDITNPPCSINSLLTYFGAEKIWPSVPAMTPRGVPQMWSEAMTASSDASESIAVKQQEKVPAVGWLPFLPQGCEDDYECNDGKANFPLQCCELGMLGRFCCEPDNFIPAAPQQPAYVPLPVPVEEPLQKQRSSGLMAQGQ